MTNLHKANIVWVLRHRSLNFRFDEFEVIMKLKLPIRVSIGNLCISHQLLHHKLPEA